MFKRQNSSVPEKQSSFTVEQILHDTEAIRISSQEQEENSLEIDKENREKWYTELQDFNSISNNLVGALDDGGDLRDQLQSAEKELQKSVKLFRKEIQQILDCNK